MEFTHLWRLALVVVGLVSLGVNASLIVAMLRHRWLLPHRGAALAYPVAGTLVVMVSIYWRLRDASNQAPLNVGDLTALVPLLSLLVAGILAWRVIGRAVGRSQIDL